MAALKAKRLSQQSRFAPSCSSRELTQILWKVTAPLRNLIKDDINSQWTPESQQSFEQVKAMLTEDIVMAYFDLQIKKRLKTDAGPGGMVATMKQSDPLAKRWRPVTHRSGAFRH